MKFLLFLMCLLLCGCAKEAPPSETTPPPSTTIPAATEPVSMYAPNHSLENQYSGALKVYPLRMRKVQGIRPMGEDLLVFSGFGSTTLTRLTGDDLYAVDSITLDFDLKCDDPSIQITAETLSFFDPNAGHMVILDHALTETARIPVPKEMIGSPILSQDHQILYYCTPNAILAWDLERGIHRPLKELHYDDQTLIGLHCDDTVLQCRILDGDHVQTLFLSTETGLVLSQQKGDVSLCTLNQQYFAKVPVSEMDRLVFGTVDSKAMVLYPADSAADVFYLPELNAVVTASLQADEHVQLQCYGLGPMNVLSELTMKPLQMPKSIVSSPDGSAFILFYDPANDCDVIYRWELTSPVFHATSDISQYIHPYSSEAQADAQLLAQCQAFATQLSEKYGFQIRIGEDAAAVQPWDYTFTAETQPQTLKQELLLLDSRLNQYPSAVLEQTASHFTSLNLCLVHQISGTAASGSLATATGVQFFDGSDAYIVIAVGKYSEQALYHELYHAMETHILNESAAMDQWNEWNPEGFEYGYGLEIPEDYSQYVSGENRAFVDQYSMTFPKEDRARIFENAMLPGNSNLFTSQTMQRKLTAVCESIREAYDLQKTEERLPWEQYLSTDAA